MQIAHRFVGFGTRFHSAAGPRVDTTSPERIHENELVVDVGGVCWGYNTDLPVLDHHLSRPGNYPSASCAVLHNVRRIRQRYQNLEMTWIVTHQNADYDALCAAYLAKRTIQGDFDDLDPSAAHLHPNGWLDMDEEIPRFDWFAPKLAFLAPQHRWAFLLASVAAHVDNARSMSCPSSRAISSVLYARIERGVSVESSAGATEFFDVARRAIMRSNLNPLFDSIFENNPDFEPELALLDRAKEAYPHDLARARKTVVYLPVAADFDSFYKSVASKPLLGSGTVQSEQLDMTFHGHSLRQADGIYLKDPQCPLFRQLARQDAASSSFGRGFLFTAIAYSGQKLGRNSTRYIFSLDPEQAYGAHLYPVWASLQAREIDEILRSGDSPPAGVEAREGYDARAHGQPQLFKDPWFDGANFYCTLVETPNRGTCIPSGSLPDLSDDPVVAIVRNVVEMSVFSGVGTYVDLSLAGGRPEEGMFTVRHAAPPAPPSNSFRFASILLASGIDPLQSSTAAQIGQELFAVLYPNRRFSVSGDELGERLIAGRSVIGVWDATGVAVAFLPEGAHAVAAMKSAMVEISGLTAEVRIAVNADDREGTDPKVFRPLIARFARLQQLLVQPENRLLQRFFDANHFEQVLSLTHELHSTVTSEQHLEQIAGVQRHTELLEVLILSVYATELAHVIAGDAVHAVWPGWAIAYYGASAVGTGIAAYRLVPSHSHSGTNHSKGTLRWLALWFLLLIAVGGWLGIRAHHPGPQAHEPQALPQEVTPPPENVAPIENK